MTDLRKTAAPEPDIPDFFLWLSVLVCRWSWLKYLCVWPATSFIWLAGLGFLVLLPPAETDLSLTDLALISAGMGLPTTFMLRLYGLASEYYMLWWLRRRGYVEMERRLLLMLGPSEIRRPLWGQDSRDQAGDEGNCGDSATRERPPMSTHHI